MLFKAVLFAVMLYLVACYAYGVYLLWKLWAGRKLQSQEMAGAESSVAQNPVLETMSAQPAYVAPAKAA